MRHHAEDLVVDDEQFGGEDLRAVEEAAAEDEVGAGEELGEHRERVLPGGLGVGLLGLRAAIAESGRQSVERRHLGLDAAQQHRLRPGGEVRAGAHVQSGRSSGVDDGRAGEGELHGDDGGDDLGVVHDRRARRCHRRRGAEDRHRVEHERDAGLGQGEGEVHAEALLVERRDGAEDAGEQRPLAELAAAAGDRLAHTDQPTGLVLVVDGDDDGVLARAAQAGVEFVQDAGLLGLVLGGDDRRRGAEAVEAMREAGGAEHVVPRRAPHRAARLAHRDGAAVDRQVGMLAVDGEVVERVTGAEREAARDGGDGALDQLGRQLGDGRFAVDRRPVRREHVERPLRIVGAAGRREDVERGLVDTAHVVVAHDAQWPLPAADGPGLGVGHRAPPRLVVGACSGRQDMERGRSGWGALAAGPDGPPNSGADEEVLEVVQLAAREGGRTEVGPTDAGRKLGTAHVHAIDHEFPWSASPAACSIRGRHCRRHGVNDPPSSSRRTHRLAQATATAT